MGDIKKPELSDKNLKEFNYVTEEIRNIEGLIESALQIFNPEEADKSISATTRKRLSHKLLQSLQISKSRIPDIITATLKIHESSKKWKKLFSKAEDNRISAMQELGSVVQKYDESLQKAKSEQAERFLTLKSNEELRQKLESLEKEYSYLHSKLKTVEDEYLSNKSLYVENNEKFGGILEENKNLRKEVERQNEEYKLLTEKHTEVMSKNKKFGQDNTTQKEVIAKLTADNLIFIMKLKESEKTAQMLSKENENLKITLKEKKGPWFDEVRFNVETQIKKSFMICEDLELELEKIKSTNEKEMEKLNLKMADILNELNLEKDKNKKLEEKVSSLEEEGDELREELKSCNEEISDMSLKIQSLTAEKEVLGENIKTTRDESSQLWMKCTELKNELENYERKLKVYLSDREQMEKRNKELEEKVKIQVSINEDIMKNKEKCEWELLDYRARLNINKNNQIKLLDNTSPALPITNESEVD